MLALYGCRNNSTKESDFLEKVPLLFNDWVKDSPGGAVAIVSNGEIIYEEYFGMANMETKIPFSNNSITDIGSISKQFTACLIALLEEESKLSIHDDIRKYLPEIPKYEETVKIEHLLFHTSGIRDYEALELIQGRHYFEERMTNKYVVELMSKQKKLNFTPNTEYEYSNSNYILLAAIIERISGKSLNEVAKERIFDPLKMKNTFFHINQGEDFVNRAIGYEFVDTTFKRPVYRSHLIGDGGLFTTLKDLIKWDENFYNNKLGNSKESLLERMKYREPLSHGTLNNMAFAQIFTHHPFGENSWSHGGSGGGYRSFYIRFEEPKFSVIVLSNTDEKNAFEKANQLVNLFFNAEPNKRKAINMESEKTQIQSIPSSKGLIEKFKGFYREIDGMDILEINFDSKSQGFIINWLENRDNGYKAEPIGLTMLAEKDDANYQYGLNTLGSILIHYEKGQIIKKWQKLEIPSISNEKFIGKYYSPEVDHKIELSISEGKLFSENIFLNSLRRIGDMEFLDEQSLAILTFELINNEIKGFSIDIPQGDRNLRGLKFEKLNE